MESISDWSEDDVRSLINNSIQESIGLDYKESSALDKTDRRKIEISKDISAFANSAGGMIIYGISENKHVPTGFDFGSDPNIITKEWLE
jgi:predicted HTH transcriptional regulator